MAIALTQREKEVTETEDEDSVVVRSAQEMDTLGRKYETCLQHNNSAYDPRSSVSSVDMNVKELLKSEMRDITARVKQLRSESNF